MHGMTDLLSFATAPAVVAYTAWQRRGTSSVRGDLRSIIAAQSIAPVADAGSVPVTILASALTTEIPESVPGGPARMPRGLSPRDAAIWETQETIRPLGLEVLEVIRVEPGARGVGGAVRGKTEMAGTRHGRRVRVCLDETTSVVEVAGAVAPFTVTACSGTWLGIEDAPCAVREWLEDLSPSRRWNGACVEGGEHGIAVRRDEDSVRSWMHDLWLAEQFARAAARSVSALV
jgi:hypothetical protein